MVLAMQGNRMHAVLDRNLSPSIFDREQRRRRRRGYRMACAMESKPNNLEAASTRSIEPRWPALMGVLVAGTVYSSLPGALAIGPRWLLFAIVVVLGLANSFIHRRGMHGLNTIIGYTIEVIVTVFLLWSVVMLITGLPGNKVAASQLLRSAAAMWVCNVVLFALWYWRLDAGGPYARHKRGKHTEGAFLFPPMTNDGHEMVDEDWIPHFVDYLFLSFNTSTALSPTDTPVISRWAKLLVMVQASISLTLVAVLAARAVNIM
jgi:hypothetical protein